MTEWRGIDEEVEDYEASMDGGSCMESLREFGLRAMAAGIRKCMARRSFNGREAMAAHADAVERGEVDA